MKLMTRMIISKYVKDYEKRWRRDENKLALVQNIISGLDKYIGPLSGGASFEFIRSREMSDYLIELADKIPRARIAGADNYIIKNEFKHGKDRWVAGGLLIAYLYSVDLLLQARNYETANGKKLLFQAERCLEKTTSIIQSTLLYPEEMLNAH
ncbi:MAG: hypothetical protein L3J65_12335 [Robiginitomaculum sp.]|nr:hypothetical protein [Robiginitomaculum sp.]